jgi:hypothetical protein
MIYFQTRKTWLEEKLWKSWAYIGGYYSNVREKKTAQEGLDWTNLTQYTDQLLVIFK